MQSGIQSWIQRGVQSGTQEETQEGMQSGTQEGMQSRMQGGVLSGASQSSAKQYVVALDLGESTIVLAVGTPAAGGVINVEHIISRASEGVVAGKIENIESVVSKIREVLTELQETTGLEVRELYAGISGEFIYCTSHTDHVYVPDYKNGVTQQVVDALFERMNNVTVSEERVIMERIPQRYLINDTTEVKNPVGVFGSPLSSTFNFISSDGVMLSRLDMALRRLNVSPRRIFSNAVVVGDAVLTPDEKEEGVVVVDLGGGLTDIAIYHRNVLRYIATIPIGAQAFNNDISTLTIPKRFIEPLKLKYGYALAAKAPKDISVLIKGISRHDQREIVVYNLAAVIEARARDIAELVAKEIAESGYADRVPYGIVLTGGSAQLRSLGELFGQVTGLDVRVAEAEDVVSLETQSNITSSADSTVVGLLLHGAKYGACEVIVGEPKVVAPINGGVDDTEAARLEAERIEKERLEAERIKKERLEAERLEAERVEAERLEAERVKQEQEQAAAEERARQLAEQNKNKDISQSPVEGGKAPIDINSYGGGASGGIGVSVGGGAASSGAEGPLVEDEEIPPVVEQPKKSFFAGFKGMMKKIASNVNEGVDKVNTTFDVNDDDEL